MLRRRALVLLLVPLAATGEPAAPLRILPLGDSITQGGRGDREELTYRWPLFRLLRGAGLRFDFIGSQHAGLHADARWPDVDGTPFDPDHEGHYGWTTAAVRDRLPEWLAGYPAPPDVALVHLGTNDQSAPDLEAAVARPLRDIVLRLRGANPSVIILLGHLNFNGGTALEIRPLVESVARELSTPASPVVTVHHYRGWIENPDDPHPDTFDWAHPNPQGQRKMAERWWEALRPLLAERRQGVR